MKKRVQDIIIEELRKPENKDGLTYNQLHERLGIAKPSLRAGMAKCTSWGRIGLPFLDGTLVVRENGFTSTRTETLWQLRKVTEVEQAEFDECNPSEQEIEAGISALS